MFYPNFKYYIARRIILPVIFMFSTVMTLPAQESKFPYRLIMVNPEHFHAALVQKAAYPEIDSRVEVYAPSKTTGLQSYLELIDAYNHRTDHPTSWKELVYTGDDFFEKMIAEKKGNIVVLAGNNRLKTRYILESVDAGLHVFADKPMVISAGEFPVLLKAFSDAQKKHLLLYDIMTERYQVTNALQRELAALPAVFGRLQQGTEEDPAVEIESVHHFLKSVSGKPLLRPAWYFDVRQQGEGMVDVSTHLVDLVQWQCFSNASLDYQRDIRMLSARRWPTVLTAPEFNAVTGMNAYPDFLHADVKDGRLYVFANGEMNYTLKAVHVRIKVIWNYSPPEGGGDTQYEILKGTKANLVIRQGTAENFIPELYIEPVNKTGDYQLALNLAIRLLSVKYPGISLDRTPTGWKLRIPQSFRLSHEATFAEVTKKYLQYLQAGQMPYWEIQCMLAKYYTTTEALKLALRNKE